MEKINEQIKILREARGLTYEQFGERIGGESSRVLMWEKGTSIPTISETRAICPAGIVSPERKNVSRIKSSKTLRRNKKEDEESDTGYRRRADCRGCRIDCH